MKTFYRVMLGQKSVYAAECFAGNFIGADYGLTEDLTNQLPTAWREFNAKFIPIYMAYRPAKSKIAAGLACGSLWTIAKGIQRGDMVLCPDGGGRYRVGEANGEYYYAPDELLPHRRHVRWLDVVIDRADMSKELQNATGAAVAVCNLSRAGYHAEVEKLVKGVTPPELISTGETVEDALPFQMEKHLEEFLVQNWAQTEFGKEFDIYEDDGERIGQQYLTDTGPLDILAISKDKKRLLVIELKKGRASDAVVGQILRYMGYVQEVLAEDGQKVQGVIIALEDDIRIRRALSMTPNIEFYRYQVSFKLVKA